MGLYKVISLIKQAQLYVGNIFRVMRDAKFYYTLNSIEQKRVTDPKDISDAAMQFNGAKRMLLENIAAEVVSVQSCATEQAYLGGEVLDTPPNCLNMAHDYANAARLVLQDGFGYHVAIKAVKRA